MSFIKVQNVFLVITHYFWCLEPRRKTDDPQFSWRTTYMCTSSGDIPENNSRKCQFFTKMTKNKKLPNFLSNFQNWFRNDLQHLTEVFRPYHPCKKSLEIDFQIPKKKVFLIFPFFSRFLGVYFYKASWLVNTCWLNVDQMFTEVFFRKYRWFLHHKPWLCKSHQIDDMIPHESW